MTVLDDIRRATRSKHHELESSVDIFCRLISVDKRRALMEAYYCLYGSAEAALAHWLLPLPGLNFRERLKTPALISDLNSLGCTAHHLTQLRHAPMPALRGTSEALGFAYVLEGATLGGRAIKKQIMRKDDRLIGMSFFDIYGSATGARWKEFCVVLERECLRNVPITVEGALAGFAFIHAGLLEDRAHGPLAENTMGGPARPDCNKCPR